MLWSRLPVLVLLVALSSSALLMADSAAPHRDAPTDPLRPGRTQGNEDLSLLLKFMAQLGSVGENEVLADGADESGVREEVARRQLALSQRERKAGCRNFFWKSFTSC